MIYTDNIYSHKFVYICIHICLRFKIISVYDKIPKQLRDH